MICFPGLTARISHRALAARSPRGNADGFSEYGQFKRVPGRGRRGGRFNGARGHCEAPRRGDYTARRKRPNEAPFITPRAAMNAGCRLFSVFYSGGQHTQDIEPMLV